MKYTVGDLIYETRNNRVGLIINATPNNKGFYWYKVEWQIYFDTRMIYRNDLSETQIDNILKLSSINKHLPVIK